MENFSKAFLVFDCITRPSSKKWSYKRGDLSWWG